MSIDYSREIMISRGGDEYYSPQNVVDMIVPYVVKSGYKKIWCPFDKEESRFVQTFLKLGYDVVFGHIETGQDFFSYSEPQGEIVVSNPPFSKRDAIFKRLYDMDIAFALVMNFNGLFDSKSRAKVFREHGVELIIPKGRMCFEHKEGGMMRHPNFQSVYVCHRLTNSQIEFSDYEFSRRRKDDDSNTC